jgi:glycerophosphoryl diester phosphodiesterase
MSPLLLGHRGARATQTIPENTMESFDLALSHGCDGFEFDVRKTADGHAVICHDPAIHGIEIHSAHAEELSDIATLDQVLGRYTDSAFLDIELKVPGLEESLISALREHPPRRGFLISSFLPEVLDALAMLDPPLPLGLLCEDQSQLITWKMSPVRFVLPHYTLIDNDLCKQVHAAGKEIFAWTVNNPKTMRQLSRSKIDGIISDDTQALVATLRDSTPKAGRLPPAT